MPSENGKRPINTRGELGQIIPLLQAIPDAVFPDYQSLYNSSPDGFLTLEYPSFQIIKCNLALTRYLETKLSELAGRHVSTILTRNSLLALDRSVAEAKSKRAQSNVELELRRENGSAVVTRANLKFCATANCDSTGLIHLAFKDLLNTTNSLQLLRETEERFQAMADSAPVLLWMSGENGDCTFFNQSWLSFTGRPLEREVGVGWAEGVHHEDLQQIMDIYMRSLGARKEFQVEYRLRRADGEYRWILDHGTPRYLPDGTFAGFIGSCIDISDRRQNESDLRDVAAQLIRNNEELQNFVYAASHDLQEPVRTIINFTELLARDLDGQLSSRDAEFMQFIEQGGKRLKQLIDDLLTYSRAGVRQRRARIVDCRHVVDEVLRILELSLQESQTEVSVCPLPEVLAEDVHLIQVFQNLLTNAMKFRSDSRRLAVKISAEERELDWKFSVSDNGIGIPPQDQSRVFGMFKRLHAQDLFPGTGLGLAICKKIIESYGGRIWVESTVGVGSTFYFSLPKATEKPVTAATRECQ